MAKRRYNPEKNKRTDQVAPQLTPPDPAHAIAHVPVHTSDEKHQLEQQQRDDETTTPTEVEDDVCFICAEPITFWSVGACGHETCHICAIRLRTFYKKTDCTFCKTPNPSVFFSRSPDTTFPTEHHVKPSHPDLIARAQAATKKDERWDKGLILPGTLDLTAFPYTDEKLGVVFEDEDVMEASLTLLRFNCPYPDCTFQAINWGSLERHTLSTHGLVICTLCRSQLSRFAHEQMLYPPHLLSLHDPSKVKRGQKPPKPRGEREIEMIKSWEAPHPMCEFCHRAFFGPDELFKHMRSDHEECHVCREQGNRHVYFENYDKLAQHWQDDHFPCTQPQCIEDRFVVFGSELDLRAHMVDTASLICCTSLARLLTLFQHSSQMSTRDRAQARHLPIDFIPISQTSVSQGVSSGRGFSLGHPNAQSIGNSSRMRGADSPQVQALDDTPAMTAEQRAQIRRQREVDVAESGVVSNGLGQGVSRRRGFATGLTVSELQNQRHDSTELEEVNRSGLQIPRKNVDEITATRHAELLSRVSILTGDNQNKLSSFRSAVRSFKIHESSARDMVDSIFNVFDRDLDVTVGIVREISKLFNDEGNQEQEKEILEAVNALRAEEADQFPSLGSAPVGLGTNYSGVASGTVLNAKRSTRTGGGSRNVWDRVEAAAASQPVNRPRPTTGVGGRWVPGAGANKPQISSSEAFPSLGFSSAGPSGTSGVSTSKGHSTPWAAGGAGSSSRSPSVLTGPQIRSVHNPLASSSKKAKPLSNTAFPALPSSGSKRITGEEKKALFSKPSTREISAPPSVSPREMTNSDDPTVQMANLAVEEQASGNVSSHQGGGKKKGKQKQLLFSVSARP
nr:cytoplasmic protein [Cryptococcus depauperatus CBS 7855]